MKFILQFFFMLISTSAFAIVDMKNANYSYSFTDIEVPGSGYDLKVTRTYNSRSLFNGMFGFGWCSDFETVLEKTPEGYLKILECGAGAEVLYAPREISRADVDKTISQILAKLREDKKTGLNEEYFKNLNTELTENADKRAELAAKYGISVPIKEGTKFFANGKEVEQIIFNKTYYTRTLPDGSSQRFSPEGKLIAQYDKNGNFLKFEYEKELLKEITDNLGRRMSFKYHPNKKVKSITGPNSTSSEYAFKDLDDLTTVRNTWNHIYKYEYDELHNLTRATWPDKTFVSLKYDKKNDWVVGFTDRDKCVETYGYEFSSSDPKGHYWSTVKKVCGKDTVADNKYEFWYKQRADGQYFLQRVMTVVDGSTTDISYHDIFAKPVSIRKNTERVSFDYYPDGQVKTKATNNAKLTFEYDPQIKKISKVTSEFFDAKGKRANAKTTEFKYDPKGNLVFAQNSEGQKITMTYDNRGRIATILDQAKKVVKIEYEERFGKPSIVTRPGLGTIKVSYKSTGEISNVESKEGPSVAMQVASTFNNLLDIIAPATAELYL